MIELFFSALWWPLFIALCVSVITFLIGYRIIKKRFLQSPYEVDFHDTHEVSLQVDSIAGDNVWSTKLDLARAYLETGQLSLAKSVIMEVASCSDLSHQNEAKHILKAHF